MYTNIETPTESNLKFLFNLKKNVELTIYIFIIAWLFNEKKLKSQHGNNGAKVQTVYI